MSVGRDLNEFEERLLALAHSERAILRYRRSTILNAVMFSLLFTGAAVALQAGQKPMGFHVALAGALAVYGLFSCSAVLNFQRALNAYRSILEKFTGERETHFPENRDRVNMILLTVFFWCLLLAILLLPLPHKLYLADGVLIFFLALSAVIKCRFADYVMEYKKRCLAAEEAKKQEKYKK